MKTKLITLLAILFALIIKINAEDTPYYQQLRDEFKEIGSTRFVGGKSEEETLANLQTGGGMEHFWEEHRKEKIILDGVTAVNNKPFKKSAKFTIATKPKVYWGAQFQIKNKAPIYKGDSILVVFWAKGKKAPQVVDDGTGASLQAYIRTDGVGKYHKNRISNFYDCKMLSNNWERYYIKTAPLEMDFPAGKLALVGMMGHKKQQVEVGGIAWMVFPKGSDLSKMPKRSWDYEGRDPNASWRKKAEERIAKYRKGNMKIKVVDATGKPVSGTSVKIKMTDHDFIFGTAVRIWAWKSKNEKNREKYREISDRYYNSVTLENCLKWQMYEKHRKNNWHLPKSVAQFYHNQGNNVRGHVLVWPSFHRTPQKIADKLRHDKAGLRKAINNHITEVVDNFKPWISDWDVTNETKVNRGYMDTLGPDAMVDWYKTAHQAAPKAKLTLNETSFGPTGGMEIGSFPEKLLSNKCRGWVDYLIQHGAPLDYLGSQAHSGRVGKNYDGKTGPEGLWAYYDYLYKRYGKRLQLTELDVKIGDASDPDQLAYQADKLRDSIIIAFAHPAFDGITQWGFWAGSHYAPSAALWTKDWQLKPNGKAYIDLVFKKWWTNAELTTDKNGNCELSSFFGKYDIMIDDKLVKKHSFTKSNKNNTLTINLN